MKSVVSQEVLDGVTVAGARAFWRMKDIETKHEELRVAVMTVASDPHLSWDVARSRLMAALSAIPSPAPSPEEERRQTTEELDTRVDRER